MLVGYARVSTEDQDTTLQTDALERAGCSRVFKEKRSGVDRDRPQLKAAIDYLREGDTLVVWKLDRLARSMSQLITTVAILEERRIGLKSLTEQIDTSTPGGKLIFHIFSALAEFEKDIIRERTRAGLQAARERGRVGGRPRGLDAQGIITVRALLKETNASVREIAKKCGISEATLYRHFPGGRSALSEERHDHG